MAWKIAIINNEDVMKILNNIGVLYDEVRIFMLVAFGMHPKNCRSLVAGLGTTKGDKITKDGILAFSRAKNQRPRRELLPTEQAEVIWDVVKAGKLRIGNRTYEHICEYYGNSICLTGNKYPTPPVSPMTFRHTYILNQLRMHMGKATAIDLVSEKAGCSPSIVRRNYLDLGQWEQIHQEKFNEPLDLTTYKFQGQ